MSFHTYGGGGSSAPSSDGSLKIELSNQELSIILKKWYSWLSSIIFLLVSALLVDRAILYVNPHDYFGGLGIVWGGLIVSLFTIGYSFISTVGAYENGGDMGIGIYKFNQGDNYKIYFFWNLVVSNGGTWVVLWYLGPLMGIWALLLSAGIFLFFEFVIEKILFGHTVIQTISVSWKSHFGKFIFMCGLLMAITLTVRSLHTFLSWHVTYMTEGADIMPGDPIDPYSEVGKSELFEDLLKYEPAMTLSTHGNGIMAAPVYIGNRFFNRVVFTLTPEKTNKKIGEEVKIGSGDDAVALKVGEPLVVGLVTAEYVTSSKQLLPILQRRNFYSAYTTSAGSGGALEEIDLYFTIDSKIVTEDRRIRDFDGSNERD